MRARLPVLKATVRHGQLLNRAFLDQILPTDYLAQEKCERDCDGYRDLLPVGKSERHDGGCGRQRVSGLIGLSLCGLVERLLKLEQRMSIQQPRFLMSSGFLSSSRCGLKTCFQVFVGTDFFLPSKPENRKE